MNELNIYQNALASMENHNHSQRLDLDRFSMMIVTSRLTSPVVEQKVKTEALKRCVSTDCLELAVRVT